MVTKGDLPLNIKWTRDMSLLLADDGHDDDVSIVQLSAKTSVLNIGAVNQLHRGIYRCIAENAAGVAYQEAEFRVNGSPHSFRSFNNYCFQVSRFSTTQESC